MPKPEKIKVVEELKEKFQSARGIVLADFTGLTVAEVNELRRKCREAQVEYRVVKNTLARIAVREANLAGLEEHIEGPTAVAISEVDPIAPAKVLSDFMKEFEKLTFKGGYIEGELCTPEKVKEIGNLPTKDELMAQVIGAINAPISQVVFCIEGLLRNVISIVDQLAKGKAG